MSDKLMAMGVFVIGVLLWQFDTEESGLFVMTQAAFWASVANWR